METAARGVGPMSLTVNEVRAGAAASVFVLAAMGLCIESGSGK